MGTGRLVIAHQNALAKCVDAPTIGEQAMDVANDAVLAAAGTFPTFTILVQIFKWIEPHKSKLLHDVQNASGLWDRLLYFEDFLDETLRGIRQVERSLDSASRTLDKLVRQAEGASEFGTSIIDIQEKYH